MLVRSSHSCAVATPRATQFLSRRENEPGTHPSDSQSRAAWSTSCHFFFTRSPWPSEHLCQRVDARLLAKLYLRKRCTRRALAGIRASIWITHSLSRSQALSVCMRMHAPHARSARSMHAPVSDLCPRACMAQIMRFHHQGGFGGAGAITTARVKVGTNDSEGASSTSGLAALASSFAPSSTKSVRGAQARGRSGANAESSCAGDRVDDSGAAISGGMELKAMKWGGKARKAASERAALTDTAKALLPSCDGGVQTSGCAVQPGAVSTSILARLNLG